MLEREMEAKLWESYHSRGDYQAREKLIEAYAPLVKYVSGRLALFCRQRWKSMICLAMAPSV